MKKPVNGNEASVSMLCCKMTRADLVQDWFIQLTLMCEYLVQHIGTKSLVKFRQAFYVNKKFMTSSQLHAMLWGMAITVDLHPWSLGVEPQEDGRVWVGASIRLRCYVAKELYHVAQARADAERAGRDVERAVLQACENHGLTHAAGEVTIPTRVYKIKSIGGKDPQFVIIVEHQNTGTMLQWVETNGREAVIVMVRKYLS